MTAARGDGLEHAGRRERLWREQPRRRAEALADLRSLAQDGAADEAVRAAWWRAVHLGCALSPQLRQAGRAACARLRARARAALAAPSSSASDPAPPHFPQPSASSLGQLMAVAEWEQWRALEGLWDALRQGNPRRIARSAEVARMCGATAAGIPWAEVEDAEALVACEGGLRAALRAGDTAGAAAAWLRVTAVWNGALAADDDAAGREMFGAWGHTMRRSLPEGHA